MTPNDRALEQAAELIINNWDDQIPFVPINIFYSGAAWAREHDPAARELVTSYEAMLEWIYKNHEMPGYSEMIYNAELALKKFKEAR